LDGCSLGHVGDERTFLNEGGCQVTNARVVLHTAGTAQRALSSTDSKFIARVIGAVNDAIVHRG